MQFRFATDLTSEEYVKQQAWLSARIDRCPLGKGDRCAFGRHTAYERVGGCLVARYYCRTCKTTFSLLPEFLAARLSGTLADVEQAVLAAEQASTQEAAAIAARPDIGVAGALRWLYRRTGPIEAACLALGTLYPESFSAPATVTHLRQQCATDAVLVHMRAHFDRDNRLASLPSPLGFCPRSIWRSGLRKRLQHKAGADPPS